jgi:hypothetical protein
MGFGLAAIGSALAHLARRDGLTAGAPGTAGLEPDRYHLT